MSLLVHGVLLPGPSGPGGFGGFGGLGRAGSSPWVLRLVLLAGFFDAARLLAGILALTSSFRARPHV
jgi:hypothetical protein